MVVLRVTSVSLFLALVACSVGEVPIGGTPPADGPVMVADGPAGTADGPAGMIDAAGGDPAQSFIDKIVPLISNDTSLGKACSSAPCHGPKGPIQPDFTSFDKFLPKYRTKPGDMAKVVTKGTHSGPPLTPASKAAFIEWIDGLPAQ